MRRVAVYSCLGAVVFTAGSFITPNFTGWRFAVGYPLSLAGAFLFGLGRGHRSELARVRRIMEPLQETLARFESARRYAAARARGPQ